MDFGGAEHCPLDVLRVTVFGKGIISNRVSKMRARSNSVTAPVMKGNNVAIGEALFFHKLDPHIVDFSGS